MATALIAPIVFANERDEVDRAATTMQQIQTMPDRGIPQSIIHNAQGLAIIRIYKAAAGFSGRVGSGVVVARTKNGWSGPAFVSIGGAGWGPQIGVQATDFVFVLNNRNAVDAFSRGANLTLGGDLSVTAGPMGRNAEAGVTPIAAVYTYSQSKGLFVGASLEGAILASRPSADREFYGRDVSPRAILNGWVKAPRAAAPLSVALMGHQHTSMGMTQR